MRDGPGARKRGALLLDASAFLLALAVLSIAAADFASLEVVVVAATMLAYFGARLALDLARQRRR